MASYQLMSVILGDVPINSIQVDAKYRMTSDADIAANYTAAGTVTVHPDGSLDQPLVINDLEANTNYTLWLTQQCSNTQVLKTFQTGGGGGGTSYSATRSADFQKQTCTGDQVGSIVTYTQTYYSTVSQNDADQQAANDPDFSTNGQAYSNQNGTCQAPLPSDATGIIVIDMFNDTALNLAAYSNTPGTEPYQVLMYPGQNFIPNDGTGAAQCWGLASDELTNTPIRRFEFNVARYLRQYPAKTSFQWLIRGRRVGAQANINGSYVLKGADQGNMIMQGSAGTYIPSVQNATSIGIINYNNKAVAGGGDGTYGLNVGSVFAEINYDVASKTVTVNFPFA